MKQKRNYYSWITCLIILIIFSLISCTYPKITHNLTILSQGNGTTDPNGEISVNEGEAIIIAALPDENGIF